MMAGPASDTPRKAPHIPVLLRPILGIAAPVSGTWLDGTFGAGGYARGLLDAGAERVIAVDQDPMVFEMARAWAGEYGATEEGGEDSRLVFRHGNFANLDEYAQDLDGIVLDLGVSSMQLDMADRGFSFSRSGPLDMRMSQSGPTAADLVNTAEESELADILYGYGEERASRRIARAIVAKRPFTTTGELAEVIQSVLPRPKPGQSHPATRSFQAIRIAVNDELGALVRGMEAAERALRPGGVLAIVTFHSIEDRIVKRFFQAGTGKAGRANRYAPEAPEQVATFENLTRRAVAPDEDELADNPRARSARLRMGRRTEAPARAPDRGNLGVPGIARLDDKDSERSGQ
ncbi:16S rRNA (cytosine1402-N4)-methyltransferase [Brevirhabdus pacifica]|nr:16S rRNA (cytosine(1402)-N(4))-methyltransferase RsmH [Brevirhabdus pacifica]PJJ85324.1 16S rRNA (cytosine1402-N4)-methyltransferase [Brevirhabdus pacifica]